jgi:hypothetical protein
MAVTRLPYHRNIDPISSANARHVRHEVLGAG